MPEARFTQHKLTAESQELANCAAGDGPLAVIIHGVGGHKQDWLTVAQDLAAPHRVAALDMPGFDAASKLGNLSISY